MVRNFLIIAAAALVLSVVCLAGAFALGGRELAANGWSWTVFNSDGESIRFERVRNADAHDTGPEVTRTLAWDGSDTLVLDFDGRVEYVQGNTAGVTVTGPETVVDRVEVVDGRIRLKDGEDEVFLSWDDGGPRGWSPRDDLRIVVTAPDVTRFRLSGSGHMDIRAYDQDQLELGVSGSGEIEAAGRTRALTLDISGSGEVDLEALELADADVTVSGSGEARLGPTGRAAVAISGSGDVTLTRRPQSLDSRVSGSGDIRQP
ncbi:GIN domain-containing protein [Brevundimonas sp.]|uniref:GIN domain-containing protein n=1 Tax=Brevundimonas sp. TaxID=1871086 RepID=UPI003AF5D543